MKNSILIFGLGQLGFRYFQGVLKFNPSLDIFLYDLDISNYDKCRKYSNEIKHIHNINYLNNINDLPNKVSIVINVITAKYRADSINMISKLAKVDYWIIEKVICQNELQLDTIKDSILELNNAWVNTSRRSWNLYSTLKTFLNINIPKKMYVKGKFQLACNAIHFIDLFAFLTKENLVSINISNLDKNWYKSKRHEYYDIFGKLTCIYSKGSQLEIISEKNLAFKLEITDDNTWQINEERGLINKNGNFHMQISDILLQSDSTEYLLKDLLNFNTCKLAPLTESLELHRIYLNAFSEHWSQYGIDDINILPIT
jgi:hypothetical protein